jgi:isopropylmalate/homocitrate/citramalate synthase
MSIQITDCTIRDGGYLFNKNSNPEFVKGIMNGLAEAGIDFVETGFLQTNVTGESLVYANSVDARKYLPEDRKSTNFLGFCDNSRYSLNELDDYDGKSFKWLRISFAQHEIEESLKFCAGAKEKGYLVQFNPMDSISYTDEAREALIEKVNKVKPASFSIVDTFGAMDMLDLVHIFKQVDDLLDKDIKIGLHSHDNLGLSCALAERMIELAEESGRDVIVDGSLFGMGRGAGNAKTELLADYINKHCGGQYDIQKLLLTIDTYITPLLGDIQWGYDLPMYVCGTKHSHVDNVYHLKNQYNCTANEMYDLIESLSPQQRIRYGTGYSKTDFSVLDKAYDNYKKGNE